MFLLKLRPVIRRAAVVTLLIGNLAAAVLVVRSYRQYKASGNLTYTLSVRKADIRDTARNALSALYGAEIHEQNYVLTGETVYSEAYAADIRKWQEEFATLELVAMKDPSLPLVQDLSKAGTRTLNELTLVLALYEKSGRDAALERIQKSSGIVYLDQARDSVVQILDTDREYFTPANLGTPLNRILASAGLLFLLSCASTGLLILEIRKGPLPATEPPAGR
jgi:CHASE3 domain sensor protein